MPDDPSAEFTRVQVGTPTVTAASAAARRATPAERAMLWGRRKPTVAAAWALGALVLVLGGFAILASHPDGRHGPLGAESRGEHEADLVTNAVNPRRREFFSIRLGVRDESERFASRPRLRFATRDFGRDWINARKS